MKMMNVVGGLNNMNTGTFDYGAETLLLLFKQTGGGLLPPRSLGGHAVKGNDSIDIGDGR